MSDRRGLTLTEYLKVMPSRELAIRLTHEMIKNGYTFDKSKIEKIQREKQQAEVEDFMQKARAHWGANR